MSAEGSISDFEDSLPEFSTSLLVEQLVGGDNMRAAYKRVLKNRGKGGVDGMEAEDLESHLQVHWARIKSDILSGRYRASAVRGVEIRKSNGGTRLLGIPTVQDRLIQQALYQVVSPLFDPHFSAQSYGFRPGRSAHQAVQQARAYQQEGKRIVVDMDLEKFFDTVPHDKLMSLVRARVKDRQVLKLIHSFLKSGILLGGVQSVPEKGTPQGSPLSPLLSNILLDVLDKELETRGHCFVRYADDCNIYVGTKRSGTRVLSSISSWLEAELSLKVNQEKSAVGRASGRTFLGYSFTGGTNPRIRVPSKSIKRLRSKLKRVFRWGKGRNVKKFVAEDLNPVLRGWINYFRLAETKQFTEDLDGWIRRRLRVIIWRQWKRNWRRLKNLMKLGLSEERAVRSAFNGRGPWWNSGASHMNQALNNQYFEKMDLISLTKQLRKLRTQ
ncbi:MAG TPA: group II intron reverse transcriptase/maturase [Cytophagales bacterium]|nr:group II intron reverse transcriptase/maturase [Cytophagales bacterium]